MSYRWSIGIVALAIAVVAVVGCGGDDSSTETAASPTKAAFVREADAVCRKAQEEIIKGASKVPIEDVPQARKEAEFKMVSTLLIPTLEEEVDRLRALGAPAGDEAEIERMLELTEGAIDEAKTEPETYVQGEDYVNGSEHYGEANRLARGYGMKNCLFRFGV